MKVLTRMLDCAFFQVIPHLYMKGKCEVLSKNKNLKDWLWKQTIYYRWKIGVAVLLRLFISSNKVCNTAYAPLAYTKAELHFQRYHNGHNDPKGNENIICTMVKTGFQTPPPPSPTHTAPTHPSSIGSSGAVLLCL